MCGKSVYSSRWGLMTDQAALIEPRVQRPPLKEQCVGHVAAARVVGNKHLAGVVGRVPITHQLNLEIVQQPACQARLESHLLCRIRAPERLEGALQRGAIAPRLRPMMHHAGDLPPGILHPARNAANEAHNSASSTR